MAERDDNKAVVGALMLIGGGIIGAGLALLLAPQTGRATRRDIEKYAKKSRRKAEEMVDDFSASIADMVEKVGEKASEIIDRGKDVADEATDNLIKAIDEGQEKLEKQRSRLAKLFKKD